MANGDHERETTLGHTFHVVKEKVGFLGLGARVQVIEDGKVVDRVTAYGWTLNNMRQHNKAELQAAISLQHYHALAEGVSFELPLTVLKMDQDLVQLTNNDLQNRFQRPHPSK